MEYVTLLRKENGVYTATVPDLNYTSSFGETFNKAVHNIIEASELYCDELETLPKARELEELERDGEIEAKDTPQIIDIKVEKNVRINVMIKADILKRANEKAKITHKGNRSAYIQELVEEDTLAMA